MNLSVGVLIIGSLYWDNNARVKWRRSRLDQDRAVRVRAPIRYGHRSCSRGNTYTMVFSEALTHEPDLLGSAIVVPCIHKVTCPHDLIQEAELLWYAETKCTDKSDGRFWAKWGCAALLVNPNRDIPAQLLDRWGTSVSRGTPYGELSHAPKEKPVVTKSGLLQIAWPMPCEGGCLEFDMLLATAIDPSLKDQQYPSAKEIALAWSEDHEGHVDYFWQNRKYGITTFQDEDIERHLLSCQLSDDSLS